MTRITVVKLALDGSVTWRYEGDLLARTVHSVVLEALFDKPDFPLLDVVLKKGDRFVETFFDDRGYNAFAIYDRDTGAFKGWYCNLSRPARIMASTVEWIDLALDLWVWPDGRTARLDEDEFADLPLADIERAEVLGTLLELERRSQEGKPPDSGGRTALP